MAPGGSSLITPIQASLGEPLSKALPVSQECLTMQNFMKPTQFWQTPLTNLVVWQESFPPLQMGEVWLWPPNNGHTNPESYHICPCSRVFSWAENQFSHCLLNKHVFLPTLLKYLSPCNVSRCPSLSSK